MKTRPDLTAHLIYFMPSAPTYPYPDLTDALLRDKSITELLGEVLFGLRDALGRSEIPQVYRGSRKALWDPVRRQDIP